MINFNSKLISETDVKFNRLQMSLRKMIHQKQVKKIHETIETKKDENRDLNLRHTKLVKYLCESEVFIQF